MKKKVQRVLSIQAYSTHKDILSPDFKKNLSRKKKLWQKKIFLSRDFFYKNQPPKNGKNNRGLLIEIFL
jgi:hypothetical protein